MTTRRMELREAVEVYNSEYGHVCIKQDGCSGESEQLISLEPEQVPKIIKWLKECLEEAGYAADIKPIK